MAVAALDPMVLFARDRAFGIGGTGAALAADDDARVFRVDFDLIALQARQLRGEDELGRRFVEVDRWRPAGRVGAHELAEVFMQREQIAERIPSREGHVLHRSMFGSALGRAGTAPGCCATI